MHNNLKNSLIKKLVEIDKKKLKQSHVVLLPDFFVDHFLYLKDPGTTCSNINKIFDKGGGNYPDIPQHIHQGGNATNSALALSKLGISSHLICRTDTLGKHLLNYFLEEYGVDISRVKTDGKIAITTALEFDKNHINIMMGDRGSVSDFSYDNLDEQDLDLISNSDLICILNWGLNHKGTDLAKNVLSFAKKHRVKTFFDSGDPSHRENEIPKLNDNVLKNENLDILGVNENELFYFSGFKDKEKNINNIKKAVNSLSNKISARIDFHTSSYSGTKNEHLKIIPTIKVSNINKATGAGDAWNAGNIFAELNQFEDEERLLLANSVAGYYISSSPTRHPNLDELVTFIKNQKN